MFLAAAQGSRAVRGGGYALIDTGSDWSTESATSATSTLDAQAGDLLVIVAARNGALANLSCSSPTGTTVIGTDVAHSVQAYSCRYKLLVDSDISGGQVTVSTTHGGTPGGANHCHVAAVIRGITTLDVTGDNTSHTDDNTPDAAAMTTVSTDVVCFATLAYGDNLNSFGTPGQGETIVSLLDAGVSATLVWYLKETAGSTGVTEIVTGGAAGVDPNTRQFGFR